MNAQHAAELRAQIDRQTAELGDYEQSITAATDRLAAANAAVKPAVDRVAQLEADLKAAQSEVAAGQPAIADAISVLDGLNANAAALRQSIATCEELLKQPITEDDPPVATPVPQVVSRFQGRAVLLQMGLLESIESAVRDSGDAMLQLAWAEVTEFRRDSPMIAALAQQLGLDDAKLDAMFIAASLVRA